MSRRGYRRRRNYGKRPRKITKIKRERKKKLSRKTSEDRRNLPETPLASTPASTPAPASTSSPLKKTSSNTVWENIVLHYLGKLKSTWKSKCSRSPVVNDKFKRVPTRSATRNASNKTPTSQNCLLSFGTDSYNIAKKKALSIVKNAVAYGLSRGIVSQNGKFFWFSGRRDTPKLSEGTCNDCSLCQSGIITKGSDISGTKARFRPRSITVPASYSTRRRSRGRSRGRQRDYSKSKTRHPKLIKKYKRVSFDDSDGEYLCKRCRRNKYY